MPAVSRLRTTLCIAALALAGALLAGCSTVRLAYNQVPHLAYWQLNRYLDLSDAQTERVRADYLQATWHASTRPATLDFDAGAKWLGLDVRRYAATDADHAVVEFVARYRVAGRAVRLHETSRFVREEGRWFYVDGDLHG